jgi:hypothetical protein
MANVTRNWAFQTRISKPNGATYIGDSAEWVLETQSVNNSLTNLANFGVAQMGYAEWADFSSPAWIPFASSPDLEQDNLVDNFANNVRLATPAILNSTTIKYTWNSRGTRRAMP